MKATLDHTEYVMYGNARSICNIHNMHGIRSAHDIHSLRRASNKD